MVSVMFFEVCHVGTTSKMHFTTVYPVEKRLKKRRGFRRKKKGVMS